MNLLTLAVSVDNKEDYNGILKVEASPVSDKPIIIVKTAEVYLRLGLSRVDTCNMVELLKGKRNDIKALTEGCRIRMEENRIIFTPSEFSGKPECSLLVPQAGLQELIKMLEGWYDVVIENPLVKYLYERNTIVCESYSEFEDTMQILKQEGLRFRDGGELDFTRFETSAITPEHPIYLSRKQNMAYTDSPRELDFVCCDFELYGSHGEVLRPAQVCNMENTLSLLDEMSGKKRSLKELAKELNPESTLEWEKILDVKQCSGTQSFVSMKKEDSGYITLTRKEIEDFWVCCADSKEYDVPYAFCMSREVYEKYYHRKFRHLIKEDYICIWECHEDTYFHATTADRVETILNSGYINPMGDATLTIGKAIYTFPQGSGRVFSTKKDLRVLSLRVKAPHIHIVDAVDSNCVIGEANFLKSIKLSEVYQGILSMDEAQALKESSWDASVGLRHYYGVKDEEFTEDMASVTVKELPEFVNRLIVDHSAWECVG